MTSKLIREELLNIIETDHVQCGEASSLASMALAAMDSEPVIIVGDDGGDALSYRRLIQSFEPGTKLYRHAQPALAIPDEMTSEQAHEIGYYYGDPVDVFARGANWMRQHIIDSTLAAATQLAPVVPDEKSYPKGKPISDYQMGLEIGRTDGWNACRAAMLNGGKP